MAQRQGEEGMRIEAVSIRLHERVLLTVDTVVAHGEVLTVMGPSGSGKSSLLAFLGGFLDPVFSASGRVLVDGLDLTALAAEDRHAGILFQDALLFPHMSVGENLLFALPSSIRGKPERRALADKALGDVGLAGFFDRDPDTLSGGQKARIALQRTLLSRPRMLLLDEPFSRLDAELRTQVREIVFARARAEHLPTVLVTHDAEDAAAAGGRVLSIGSEGERR